MKVLVIPEDPTNNGYILKPLVKRILEFVGKRNASVVLLANPHVQGYPMVKAHLIEIAERYCFMDLLLFLPDGDCKDRKNELALLERNASECGAKLIACAAVEEVETWLLAGHVDKLPVSWQLVRQECSVKETYFEPFLRRYGDEGAGGGRERLMRETLHNYDGLLARCPELRELQDRIRAALDQ
jgi:hypothetical protein